MIRRSPGFYLLERPKPTHAMVFGSLVHTILLEPDRVRDYTVVSVSDKRSKEWRDRKGVPNLISADDYERANRAADAVLNNRLAREVLSINGIPEASAIAVDHVNQEWIKARFDYLAGNLHVSLKTARDPSPSIFMMDAERFGYHISAGLYEEVMVHGLGIEDPVTVFIVVGSEPPHDVAVYYPTEEFIARGHQEMVGLIQVYQECKRTGKWIPSWSKKPQTLDVVPWKRNPETSPDQENDNES